MLRKILEKVYNHKRKLTLKKICDIGEIKLPKELKKYQNKIINKVSLSPSDLEKDCIYFCTNYDYVKDYQKEDIKNNCFLVFTPKLIEGPINVILKDPITPSLKIFKYIRDLTDVKVITVTGSIGKTSTKEMIESVLRQKYNDNMLVSIGNSNSRFKVAYNISRLSFNDKIYLQEVGAGSLAYNLVKIPAIMLNADIAVYTNIRDSHIEWYGSRENIAKEKFTLSDYGKENGLAIINYDDEILRKHKFKQKTYSYSLNNKEADYYAKDINVSSTGTSFTITDNIENKTMKVKLKLIGEHHILNALVAYIIGRYLKIKKLTILKGLKAYKTSGVRQNLIDVGAYKVLADCYNSSYDAIKSILKTLTKIQNKGRKIAVIGDIFELGKISEETHQKVGKLLASSNLDKVIFTGKMCKHAFDEYQKIKNNASYCENTSEMIKFIQKNIKENDLILFKASHGMHFAEAIDILFGTEVGEISDLGHKEYLVKKDKNYVYNVFNNHVTIKEYLGSSKTIKLPRTFEGLPVTMLGKVVFKENKNIKEIVLPSRMIRLRGHSFKNSTLEKITFNKNLKAIGPGTFKDCQKLKEIKLPEGLLMIEYKAFMNCLNLENVYIPASVKKISNYAFLDSNKVIINCPKDSYALEYAKKHDIKYKIR